MIFRILVSINMWLIIYITTVYLIFNIKFIKLQVRQKILKLKITQSISSKLNILLGYSPSSKMSKKINSLLIILVSIIFSLTIYIISIVSIKILSTSMLLAIIALIIPYIAIDIALQINIGKIKTILPSYIVNLKSNIEVNNNIIKSIAITKVEEPLKHKIDIFNAKVNRGINVYECFDELKKSINIESFTSLINAFKICYLNGGEYIKVLDKYIDITSKENMQKAKLKESSNTTILTLAIMVIINVFLLFSVILSNEGYRKIMLETVTGHIIINFGIISYMIIGYFVYKIYKMEG